MCLSWVNTRTGEGENMIGAYTVATNAPSWGMNRSNCEFNNMEKRTHLSIKQQTSAGGDKSKGLVEPSR